MKWVLELNLQGKSQFLWVPVLIQRWPHSPSLTPSHFQTEKGECTECSVGSSQGVRERQGRTSDAGSASTRHLPVVTRLRSDSTSMKPDITSVTAEMGVRILK